MTPGPVASDPDAADRVWRFRRGPMWLITGTALVVLVVDHVTKWLALNGLEQGEPVHLFWTIQLNLIFNRGASFSIGESYGWLFGLMAIAVVGVLLRTGVAVASRLSRLGTGCIIGGAIGNLLDRLFRADEGFMSGAVVDFVDFQWWPVWNVADAAILIGGAMVVLVASRG